MTNFNLSKKELKILRFLRGGKMMDVSKLIKECGLEGDKEADSLLDYLKGHGLVKGTIADVEGWILASITHSGEQILRRKDVSWYKKISWKKILKYGWIVLVPIVLGAIYWIYGIKLEDVFDVVDQIKN